MSRKKPLSAEEKRTKMLEIFHETCDVFQLKDLERRAPQEKGIVMQSVKVALQELVDMGQVRSEKIGGTLYFWAFPSEALNATRHLLEECEKANTQMEHKIENAKKQLEEVVIADDADAVATLEREIDELKKEKMLLQQRANTTIGELDYDELEAKKNDIKKILEAVNRWTDNIFATKMWIKRQFGKEDSELELAFGIPDDLDYLEL